MVAKLIIACLDVKDGRVVKGTQFINLRDAGDPVELARFYDRAGADELVLLDISASLEGRGTMLELVERTAAAVQIPLTVGGGINDLAQMQQLFAAGADKISLNTAAVQQPELLTAAAARFGGRRLVLAIDAKWSDNLQSWEVYTHGGRQPTGKAVLPWAAEAEARGVGAILLTSIDADGGKEGYDLALTAAVAETVSIPVIASGGAGSKEHFYDVLTEGKAAAALAASVFHYQSFSIAAVKAYLAARGVPVKYEQDPEI
ncbi:MAG: imidazole glycerol phosphate synthase subunit HisF [Dethiobacteraceae bacterium]|jgi:cyclase|nr:imidazole glycerol phosphate synthase subunit HisF [Bacillota bacterium]